MIRRRQKYILVVLPRTVYGPLSFPHCLQPEAARHSPLSPKAGVDRARERGWRPSRLPPPTRQCEEWPGACSAGCRDARYVAAAAALPTAASPSAFPHLQAELTFDGVVYILTVRCMGGDALEVIVERKEDASTWGATFAAKCERRARAGRQRCRLAAPSCPSPPVSHLLCHPTLQMWRK